ncbi:hypothetical protein [Kitasatospora sp. GP82]|uniref:hypothetical protein n=1 Tax=Kitasatospora sp. GP82 TaxID=3035089 RepID=UPI002475055C|nr:hypothetical protein [Kitasatospora sp. GP82]MDH6129800.1 hypothetical protein [Kitasatospora sp. GP82]
MLPTPLPGLLPLGTSERLLLLGALSYLTLGLAYLAFDGISSTWSRFRWEIGTGPAATLAAAAAWTTVLVLWPVPLVCRTFRTLRNRPQIGPAEELIWRSTPRQAARAIPAQPAIAAAELPVPPRWFRQEYEAIRSVLTEGGVVTAQARALGLVDASALAFGPGHPFTAYAWDLLAHTARAEQQPGDPRHEQTSADSHSVYCCPGCPAATAVAR